MILDPPPHWFDTLPEGWDPVNNPSDPLIWIDRDTGRFAALVAPHDECILDGNEGYRCITPPRSKTGYEYAHVGSTRLSTGERIKTANLGGRVNHADRQATMSLAQDHYANTATRWARGRYFEDGDGNIWIAGALSPGVDEHTMVELEGSALSGDWRWIEKLSNLELAGSQLVNTPAFRPSYHAQFALAASMDGKQVVGLWAAVETKSVVIVALPAEGQVPYPDAHVTLSYVGRLPAVFDPRPLLEVVATAAIRTEPYFAKVSGTMNIGDDKVPALLLEAEELQWVRDQVAVFDNVLDGGEGFPSWIPHMSVSYAKGARVPRNPPETVLFDRLALWAGDERYEIPMVGERLLTAAMGESPVFIDGDENADWLHHVARTVEDDRDFDNDLVDLFVA